MAQGATEFIDISSADVFLMEVWSKMATVAREKKLVFLANCDRRYESELKAGQILRIHEISNLTATAKSEGTAISYETVSEAEETVQINQFYYAAFGMEDVVKPMVSLDLVNAYMPKIGYALAANEDAYVASFIDDGAYDSYTVGTLATGLTYDNLVRADQYLNDAEAPDDERFIIISHAEKANFLKMDQFINRDYADIRQGLLGGIFNYPIFVTGNTNGSNANGHDNFMGHKSSIVHIQQIQPVIRTDWDIDYLAAKVVGYETYGTTVVREDHGVWLKGM